MIRSALVTGAAGGIGKAIVETLLDEGFEVLATDLELPRAREPKPGFHFHAADLTRDSDVESLRLRAAALWPELRVLVNAAAIFEPAPVAELDAKALLRSLDVNFLGVFRVTRAMLEHFPRGADGGGSIINISSLASDRAVAGFAAYGASKAALNALTRALALELAPRRIRVNAISPGYIDTPMLSQAHRELVNLAALRIPARRLGRVSEVAELVRLLAVSAPEYLNGAVIPIDGGLANV